MRNYSLTSWSCEVLTGSAAPVGDDADVAPSRPSAITMLASPEAWIDNIFKGGLRCGPTVFGWSHPRRPLIPLSPLSLPRYPCRYAGPLGGRCCKKESVLTAVEQSPAPGEPTIQAATRTTPAIPRRYAQQTTLPSASRLVYTQYRYILVLVYWYQRHPSV
jgi:hypothetical protein